MWKDDKAPPTAPKEKYDLKPIVVHLDEKKAAVTAASGHHIFLLCSEDKRKKLYSLRARLLCEFLGSMFLVLGAISPVILCHDVLKSDIAWAV
jgi:hypothetical protein